MASWFRVLGVFVVSVAAACSAPGGLPGGSGSAGDASTPVSTPSSPTEICSMYVTCMSHADPAGLGVVLAAYGPDGTCWETGDTTSVCQQACIAGIAQERAAGSFGDACPMCATDGDCAIPGNSPPNVPFGGDKGSMGPVNTPVCSAGTCVCAPMAHACTVSADCCSDDCEANVCTCPAGTADCDGTCLDVTSDDDNCGACGHTCPNDSKCSNGVCDCAGAGVGLVACGNECTEVASDPHNCGACGVTCSAPTSTCSAGVCSCGGDRALCNGACISVISDPNNCGACGATCPSGTVCIGDGTCGVTVTNPASTTTCESVCSGVSAPCTQASFVFPGCDTGSSTFTMSCSETVDAIEQAEIGMCFPLEVTSLSCACGTAKAP